MKILRIDFDHSRDLIEVIYKNKAGFNVGFISMTVVNSDGIIDFTKLEKHLI